VTVVPPPPSPAPPSGPSRASQEDGIFIEKLNQAGVVVDNVPLVVRQARQVCVDLRHGTESKQSEAQGIHQINPASTPAQLVAIVDATTWVYCPDQYGPWTYYP
jgi:hypothetical protein